MADHEAWVVLVNLLVRHALAALVWAAFQLVAFGFLGPWETKLTVMTKIKFILIFTVLI